MGDAVEVTVVDVDPAKRRIGLSMVETARRTKEAAETEERRDTERMLGESTDTPAFGTLADLLKKPGPAKR